MRTIGIRISYDGSRFHGWQMQPQHSSVQQTMEVALARCLGDNTRCHGASRTDSGVHATGQYAHIHTESSMTVTQIRNALNALLPTAIRVRSCHEHMAGFHARYSSIGRSYSYQCYHADTVIPQRSDYALYVKSPLRVRTLNQSMRALIGMHDFRTFCKLDTPTAVVRTMHHASLGTVGNRYQFNFTATGFCRNMIRSMVGTLLGAKQISTEFVHQILEAQDRRLVGTTAPPHGLYLQWVHY